MKKILLTLLLIVGGFVGAQAQDTITARYFEQDGTRYVVAYAESDNEQCIDYDTQQVLSWNTSTGVLTFNDSPIDPFTGTQKTYWDGVFNGSSLYVFPANANNTVSQAPIQGIAFNE